jgi:peptidoglycan/LPS O-acetylase OafA/YrhL
VLAAHGLPIIVLSGFGESMLRAVADAGAFGVDLFFVLSGFLITGILLDAPKGEGYFKNFYARRMLRLFPLYYAFLLLLMTVVPWLHHVAHTTMTDYTGNWWWYITYFCNWKANHAAPDPYLGPFWSLAVEEQFYLVWPTVILIIPRRYLAFVCGALILSALILRGIWSHEGVYWNQIYRLTVTRWDTIAFGALAALAMRSAVWGPIARRSASGLMAFGLVGLLAVAFWQGTINWINPAIQVYGATLGAIGFTGLVLYAASARPGRFYQWLQKPLMLALGRYSYAIYVIHYLVFQHIVWLGIFILKKGWVPALPLQIVVLVTSCVTVFCVAALSWRFFESPILRLKSRFV